MDDVVCFCNKWINNDYPLYDIKFADSKNGIDWTQNGKVCIKLKKGEGSSRPLYL